MLAFLKKWIYNLEFGSKNGVTLENTGLRRFLCMALWHLFRCLKKFNSEAYAVSVVVFYTCYPVLHQILFDMRLILRHNK